MSSHATNPSLSHRFEYLGFRLLRAVLLLMPIDAASAFMGFFWRHIAPFNKRHKRVLRHISWALGGETTATEREIIARNMWENLGRTFAEALILDKILKDKTRIAVSDEQIEILETNPDKAAIFVSHHFGNWELCSVPSVWHSSRQFLGVYKRVKNNLVDEWLKDSRKVIYPGGLYSSNNRPVRTILKQISQGVTFAMISDLRDGNGQTVCFFDMPTKVSIFPATLCVKMDLPLYMAQIRRTKGANFALDLVKIDVEPSGDRDSDVAQLTQACHRQFEQWIRLNPDQWMWAPYRWKGRYEDETPPMSWSRYVKEM